MYNSLKKHLTAQLDDIRQAGLYKEERLIATPQGAHIAVAGGREVLNFCANNYLGLSNDPRMVAAAKASFDKWGFGLSSVRFICGNARVAQDAGSQNLGLHGQRGHDPL